MKIGVKLHHSGPGASPDYMYRWAKFIETLGFHMTMTGDHIALTPEVLIQYPDPYYEAFTNLAWLAPQTQKIKLGTSAIVIPYRNPVYLARITASLDQLSGGRLVLGVAAGWARSEFDALGVPFHKRGAITDDYLSAIQVLWTNDVATYDGPFVSFRDVKSSPRPLQVPHPPIWVGGSSNAAMRRSVRFGSSWHPSQGVRLDWLRDKALPKLRQIADSEGLPVPALCPRIFCRLTASPLPEDERKAGEGTLDQVRGDLADLQDLGAEHVLLDTKKNSSMARSTRHHEEAWRTLVILAEKVLDLEKETVR